MSWIQNLHETYEACAGAVGISVDEQDKMLLPIGHSLKESNIAIHLRSDGTFDRAEKSTARICSPCSDESESRSSKGAAKFPYPLFDQIKHLTGKLYLDNLRKWQWYLKSTLEYPIASRMISAVHKYIASGTLRNDLKSSNITPDNKFVRFCVSIDGQLEDRLWMIPEIWDAWNSYFESEELADREARDICYVSGILDRTYTKKHPKNINRASGNAKLISGNDGDNFTYRGKFEEPSQAVTISYEASQKAHQMLRWLIMNQGYRCDTQAIVTWAVDAAPEVPHFYEDSYGLYASEVETDSAKLTEAENITSVDYAKWMNAAFLSSGNSNRLRAHARRIAVVATDAATDGRMSITYYRELGENEYLERVVNWHNTCSWYQPFRKHKGGKYEPGYFIGAPSFDRISDTVLGRRRSLDDKSYDKLKKATRERLLHCVFDGNRIPRDMVNAALHRASNPLAFEKTDVMNAVERWRDWEQVLSAACALTKKYYHDYSQEEYRMALEEERTDRDYLYGRLLAVADRIESVARYRQGNAKDDARATNAIRYMPVFSQRPFRTWNMLFTLQLNPYIQQLNGADWYLNIIGETIALFEDSEFETDAPLKGAYLLGFFAQRHELRKKRERNKNTEDGGVDNELN